MRCMPIAPGCRSILMTGRTADEFRLETPLGNRAQSDGRHRSHLFISHALPGDPAAFFAGPAANAASIANIRTTLGLDRPLPEQFLRYVNELVHGNLGHSLTTGQPVLTDLVERLPASLELSAFALLFAVGLALPLGVWAATRVNGPVDHACRALVTVSAAFP